MKSVVEKNAKQEYNSSKKLEEQLVPTNDYFARYLFANPGNEGILLHFLNALRKNANEEPFTAVEILDTFNLKENVLERETVVDVKARTASNELVMVEVQNIANVGFVSRILYYIAVNYAKQVNIDARVLEDKKISRIDYTKLKPVISVSLLNCDLKLATEKAHSVYRMKELDTGNELSKDWEVHLLELKKDLTGVHEDLALWIRFFTSKNMEEDKMAIVESNPYFEEVFERYKKFSGDVELMEKYRDIQAYIITQQHMYDIEREEGRQEGLLQGKEQGAREKALEMAKKLVILGMNIAEIVDVTALNEQDIKDILVNNNK